MTFRDEVEEIQRGNCFSCRKHSNTLCKLCKIEVDKFLSAHNAELQRIATSMTLQTPYVKAGIQLRADQEHVRKETA
jgi:hypothetical protein